MLNKLKHFLPMYIMRTIYCSLILSHLQYCTLLWENSYCTNLNKLRILQKKAIRIITNSHYIAHTDPLFSKLKLLKLDDLYKHQLGIFMYKAANNKLPDSMSSKLTRIQNIHKHNLRNQNSYYIQNIRTNSRKCTINYSGPVFWNALPSKLKQLVSINQFKNKLKELYSLNINDFTVNTAKKNNFVFVQNVLYIYIYFHMVEKTMCFMLM